jgi:hypothetical protein
MTIQIDEYIVNDQCFMVKVFPYPQHNEIDFEVYTVAGEYLYTITSNAPELSTSVVRRYILGDRTHINYSSED